MSLPEIVETELETGDVLTFCKDHRREHCHVCCVDFREMNEDARRASKAAVSYKSAKKAVKGPCKAEGCTKDGVKLCTSCKKVNYCSRECQVADWKNHKEFCLNNLPTFVTSFQNKTVETWPVGTTIEMVGGTSPLVARILKFNPPGTGSPSDCTAENLATYSLRKAGEKNSEVWDEPCEDVHDEGSWKKIE